MGATEARDIGKRAAGTGAEAPGRRGDGVKMAGTTEMRQANAHPQKRNRERERMRRQQLQLQEQQKKARKNMILFGVLTWCILLFNLLFLFAVHNKISKMEALLNRAAVVLQLIEEDDMEESVQAAYRSAENTAYQPAAESYADLWGLNWVDRPVERTYGEVMERLAELAEESDTIKEIYENSHLYPDKLLEALANNPEMAGFAAGYLSAGKGVQGGLTEEEKAQAFPLFLQWDPRWGYAEYGDDSCIGLAGCGPTCLSMALFYLTGDETLTPDKIGDYSMKNGYYVSGTGTAWALLADVPGEYGLQVEEPDASERTFQNALDKGKVIICSMGPGEFTAAGHFVVIYGYDEEGVWVNDPNCVARSRRQWTYEEIGSQIKHVWIIGR